VQQLSKVYLARLPKGPPQRTGDPSNDR
jgi:hypothetical protein